MVCGKWAAPRQPTSLDASGNTRRALHVQNHELAPRRSERDHKRPIALTAGSSKGADSLWPRIWEAIQGLGNPRRTEARRCAAEGSDHQEVHPGEKVAHVRHEGQRRWRGQPDDHGPELLKRKRVGGEAGSGKIAFPHSGARETGRPARRWLRQWFAGALLVAGRLRVASPYGRGGRAGCARMLCRRVLRGGVVARGTC